MERRIFAVLVLMAAVAAYGTQGPAQLVSFEAHFFGGPVCYPGDPCGPGGVQISESQDIRIVDGFSGPMCFPGDPCGPGGVRVNPLALGPRVSVENFSGPMCFPGDPCGPGGVRIHLGPRVSVESSGLV